MWAAKGGEKGSLEWWGSLRGGGGGSWEKGVFNWTKKENRW